MKLAAFCLALATCGQAPKDTVGCLRYEPVVVELTGTLVVAMEYGPPGYGENPAKDQRVQVLMIKLDRPVDVCGDPESETNQSAFRDVRRIQLITDDKDYRPWIGRRVVIRGTLSEAITGHHYTDVLLTVRELREASNGEVGRRSG